MPNFCVACRSTHGNFKSCDRGSAAQPSGCAAFPQVSTTTATPQHYNTCTQSARGHTHTKKNMMPDQEDISGQVIPPALHTVRQGADGGAL